MARTAPRFAVIGFGTRGHTHLRGLSSVRRIPARCVAVSDPRRPAAAELRRLGIRHHADPEDLLRKEDLDFAVVASPEAFHVGHALSALRRGLPVLLEKAVSNTWEGAVRLYREVVRHSYPLFVGYNMRRFPVSRAVKTLVDRGTLGRIQSVLGHVNGGTDWGGIAFLSRYYRDARLSGDIVLSKLTHDTDWVQHVIGSRAGACWGMVGRNIWKGRPDFPIAREFHALRSRLDGGMTSHDVATVSFVLQNETHCTLVFTTVGPDYERRYTINGTKGQIEIIFHTNRPGAAPSSAVLWLHGKSPRRLRFQARREMHGGADRFLHREFMEWVSRKPSAPNDPLSILDGMVVPTAALLSARTGRVVDCATRFQKAVRSAAPS